MDQRDSKLADLVERYYALLYRYAYRLTGSVADAEDITQTTFLAAHSKWDQLEDESKAKSWLFTIARNAYLKGLRGPSCVAIGDFEMFAAPSTETRPAEIDEENLQNVLNKLPEEFRSPVVLFYFEDFSYREIAEQMGVPVGTVMSRLARAKAYLREHLSPPSSVGVVQRRSTVPVSGSGSISRNVPTVRVP
jgi:RNA polymerase sigma-70 factor (ECF subfamily)